MFRLARTALLFVLIAAQAMPPSLFAQALEEPKERSSGPVLDGGPSTTLPPVDQTALGARISKKKRGRENSPETPPSSVFAPSQYGGSVYGPYEYGGFEYGPGRYEPTEYGGFEYGPGYREPTDYNTGPAVRNKNLVDQKELDRRYGVPALDPPISKSVPPNWSPLVGQAELARRYPDNPNANRSPWLSKALRQRFWRTAAKTGRSYWQLKQDADRLAAKAQRTVPYHVGSTFLFLATVTALAAIEETKKQERLTGKPSELTRKEIFRVSADAVVNDASIWSALLANSATDKVFGGITTGIQHALGTAASRAIVARILQSTLGTTTAFFGWTAGSELIRMACNLDMNDYSTPGGSPTKLSIQEATARHRQRRLDFGGPEELTPAEKSMVQTRFMELLALPVIAALGGRDVLPPSQRKNLDATLAENRDILGKVLRNMYYILFANEELRELWLSATVRLGLFTGDMILFGVTLSIAGAIGTYGGSYLQAVSPIPGTALIVGFLASVGGAFLTDLYPDSWAVWTSKQVWVGRTIWSKADEEVGLQTLQMGLADRFSRSVQFATREESIQGSLGKLRAGREGAALVLLERLNARLRDIQILTEDNQTAERTTRVNRKEYEALAARNRKYFSAGSARSEAPSIEKLLPDVAETVRMRKEISRMLDIRAIEKDLAKLYDENVGKIVAYGKEVLQLQEELADVYTRQIKAFDGFLETAWARYRWHRYRPSASDADWGKIWQMIYEEQKRMLEMNTVLQEISISLGDGGIRPKESPYPDATAEEWFGIALTMIPILVVERVNEERIQLLFDKVEDRYNKYKTPDQYSE